MANTHTIFNGTHCAFWDVDAYNLCGICAGADLDNGVFVTLGDIALKTTGGYEFAVTAATSGNGDYICGTPAQGYGIEAQVYDDPRYFYNEAGKPISVKRLVVGDCIELTAAGFTAAPADDDTNASLGAGGKLTSNKTTSAPYKILATNTIDVGGELVKSWILMKMA